jgi:hypothetical protein
VPEPWSFDVVLTVCDAAERGLSRLPGRHPPAARRLPDPSGQGLERWREVRDAIGVMGARLVAAFAGGRWPSEAELRPPTPTSAMADAVTREEPQVGKGLGLFERYLSLWVALCIVAGVAIGQFLPVVPATLQRFTYAEVSIPIAMLIWLMIFPMMLQIDFGSVLGVRRQPKGLTITLVVNWLIKPFSMLFFAWLFLQVIFAPSSPRSWREYVAARSCSAPRRARRWCSCGATSPAATRATRWCRSRSTT